MYNHINPKNGQKAPLIADDVFAIIMEVWPLMLLSLQTCCDVTIAKSKSAYLLL